MQSSSSYIKSRNFGYEDTELIQSKMVLCLVFGYEDAELILPMLILCLGVWIWVCSVHPAKVATLSGILDIRMPSSSFQSW